MKRSLRGYNETAVLISYQRMACTVQHNMSLSSHEIKENPNPPARMLGL